ncbi:MAG: hypothetical protein ACERLG_02430 [Sedimentibacter sp.]
MKLISVKSNTRKTFLNFYKKQYLNHPLKRDSLSGLVKGLLYGKSELCKSVDLDPIMVVHDGKIIMICILAFAYRMPNYIQIGFFESEEFNMDGFMLIMDRAEKLAREKGASTISASLNIHVNYGLGFLASDYDKKQSFGMAHNPKFIHEYFERTGFKSIDMVSYKKDMTNMDTLLNDDVRKKLETRYTVRKADLDNLEYECSVYTEVNNQAFSDHLFYYLRKKEEDYELFKDLKFLLKPENLLFVEREGKPVGFMLWYPDFNQLMIPTETVGIRTVIKNNLFSNKITTFKIVEMGVIPSEKNKGAILALFDYCFKCTKGKFDNFESGWILSENTKSKNFGIKWADCESKHYKAYIKELTYEQK